MRLQRLSPTPLSSLLSLAGALALAACGQAADQPAPDAGPELVAGFDPGPAPANGMQLLMPPVRDLAPGASVELCSTTKVQLPAKIDVRKIAARQAEGGHHVALYWSMVPGNQAAHECTDFDMVNYRFVGGASNQTTSDAPGALAFEIPAGAYLAVQQHFINATDAPLTTQSVLDLHYAEPGQTYTPTNGLAFTKTTLDLAPGASSVDIHCTMQDDLKAWMHLPHMHNYGVTFTATLTHAGVATPLESRAAWDKAWEFEPPQTKFDPATPLVFAKGDTVDVRCTWDNTSGRSLKFGQEMCVFFVSTIDDKGLGNQACDDGSWSAF